jgi:ABC-type sugar transport system ATPase subunit
VNDLLLEVRKVTKTFPGITALDEVSLTVRQGEIVALLGHNGSGKSTLVKLLSGIYRPDGGSVVLKSPGGETTGLHVIHQSLGLISNLSVIENLDITERHAASGLLPFSRRRERRAVQELIAQFGVEIDVDLAVGKLTAAQQTIVALVRALNGWTTANNVLVLDEPTAALHGDEVGVLQNALREIAKTGAGIIYISHRLGEVVEIADRVIVLKDGKVVAEEVRGAFDQSSLVTIIAGGQAPAELETRTAPVGQPVLTVRGLHGTSINGIDLDVAAGEIVGVSGLIGSGMEQLNAAIFGGVKASAGFVAVDGRRVAASPEASIRAGIAMVPADRRILGSIGSFSAGENIVLPRMSPLRRALGWLDRRRERADVEHWMSRVRVVPSGSSQQKFELFSGGNQQKIVLAKWLRLVPRILLLDEPTQGVDVGAQAEIYELIVTAAREGAAVLVSSTDTKELAALCDRVVVLRDGIVVQQIERAGLTESSLVRAVVDDQASTLNTPVPDSPVLESAEQ